MKKLMILMLSLVLSVTACSGGTTNTEEQTSGNDEVKVNIDKNKDTTVIEAGNDTKIEVSNDMQANVPLPEGYPDEILPIYKGAKVMVAMENVDESYSVVILSEDAVEEVKAFYDKVTEEAVIMAKQQDKDSYMVMGDLNGSAITVIVEAADEDQEMDGFKSMASLTVLKGEIFKSDMNETEEKSDEEMVEEEMIEAEMTGELVIPNTITLPGDYPSNTLPLYTSGKSEVKTAQQGYIGLMTEDKFDTVMNYYRKTLSTAQDFGEFNMPPSFMISGTLNGVWFSITLADNNEVKIENERFNTLIQINYE